MTQDLHDRLKPEMARAEAWFQRLRDELGFGIRPLPRKRARKKNTSRMARAGNKSKSK